MIMILFKSLGKRTSIGSYYDEKSLTKCYWDGDEWLFCLPKSHSSPSLSGSFIPVPSGQTPIPAYPQAVAQ